MRTRNGRSGPQSTGVDTADRPVERKVPPRRRAVGCLWALGLLLFTLLSSSVAEEENAVYRGGNFGHDHDYYHHYQQLCGQDLGRLEGIAADTRDLRALRL